MNEMWNLGSSYNQDNPWYNNMYMGTGSRQSVSKRDILDFIKMNMQTEDIVQVDSFEGIYTRHICSGGKKINVLKENMYPLQLGNNKIINIRYFYCPNCRKCIVSKESIEMVY